MDNLFSYSPLNERNIFFFVFLFEIISLGLYFVHPYLAILPAAVILSIILFYSAFLAGPLPWIFLMIIATGLDNWGKIIGGVTVFHVAWGMSVITLIYSYLTQNLNVKFNFEINKYVAAYILIALVSLIYSPNKISGLQILSITIALFFVFILTANFIKTKKHHLVVFWSLVIAGVFNSLVTFYQILFQNVLYFGRGAVESSSGEKIWRASGAFYDPNILAVFLIITIILGFAVVIYSDLSKKVKFLIVVSSFISTLGVLATFSRTGLVSLAIGVFAVSLFHRKKIYILYVFGALLSIVGIIILFTDYGGFVVARFLSIFDVMKDVSIRTRIGLIKSGLAMFVDHPFLGIGFRGFPKLYYYYIDPITPALLLSVNEPHTLYVSLLAELGVQGLLVIIILFYKVIKDTLSLIKITKNDFNKSILIGNLGIFISLLVTYFFYGNLFPQFNIIWINLGIIYSYQVGSQK